MDKTDIRRRITQRLRRIAISPLFLWLPTAALAPFAVSPSMPTTQSGTATVIESVKLDYAANSVRVRIEADGSMEHRVPLRDEPRELILDILNVRNSLEARPVLRSHPLLESLRIAELPAAASGAEGGQIFSRFLFRFTIPARHRIWNDGNHIELMIVPDSLSGEANPNVDRTSPDAEKTAVATVAGRAEKTPAVTMSSGTEPAGTGSAAPTPSDIASLETTSPQNESARPEPAQAPASASAMTVPSNNSIEPAGIDPALFFGPAPSASAEYKLGPEDMVEIRVFEMDQFNQTARVSGDGTISLPLIGAVTVGGLGAGEAAAMVAERLETEFVQDPQVNVLIREFNSRKVSLVGAVNSPATYPLVGRQSLLGLLADAGGVSENADKALYVFRSTLDGRRARLLVPLSELFVSGDPRWDIWLRPGDIISVPPQEFIRVSVLGAVTGPGIYELPSRAASLLNALASASGLNQRASKKSIEIRRRDESGKEIVIKVNLDDVLSGKKPDVTLQEGDVVYVNEKFF